MPLVPSSSRGSGGLPILTQSTLSGSGTFNLTIADATYSDLIIVGIIRGTRSAIADGIVCTFNSDTTAGNYDTLDVDFNAAAVAGTTQLGTLAGALVAFLLNAATADANTFGIFEMSIPGYASTTWKKNWQSLSWGDFVKNTSGSMRMDHQAGTWHSTAAVTSLQFFGQNTANLAAGSVIRVYGRL